PPPASDGLTTIRTSSLNSTPPDPLAVTVTDPPLPALPSADAPTKSETPFVVTPGPTTNAFELLLVKLIVPPSPAPPPLAVRGPATNRTPLPAAPAVSFNVAPLPDSPAGLAIRPMSATVKSRPEETTIVPPSPNREAKEPPLARSLSSPGPLPRTRLAF